MSDNLSPEDRRKTMRAIKSSGTSPERRFRSLLAGLRLKGWLVSPIGIIGKPDFAFPKLKIAIFIDGCFWHGCPECKRPMPQTNADYWVRKIERNINRDREYTQSLHDEGWKVLRIWGHQLRKGTNLQDLSREIRELFNS